MLNVRAYSMFPLIVQLKYRQFEVIADTRRRIVDERACECTHHRAILNIYLLGTERLLESGFPE